MNTALVRPAGFWIRAVALVLDVVVFWLVQLSFRVIAGRWWGWAVEESPSFQSAVAFFTLVFTGAYSMVLHSLTGQTLGKMAVGIRVLGIDGELLPPGAALLRYFGYYVSLLTFGFGYLVAALRKDKRALHDLIAGSRVERMPARMRASTAPPITVPPFDQTPPA